MKKIKWIGFGCIGLVLTILGVLLFGGNKVPVYADEGYLSYDDTDDKFEISLSLPTTFAIGETIPDSVDIYSFTYDATITAYVVEKTTADDTDASKLYYKENYWKSASGVYTVGKTYGYSLSLVYSDTLESVDHSSMSIVVNDYYYFTDSIITIVDEKKTYTIVTPVGTLDENGYYYGGYFKSAGDYFQTSAKTQKIESIEMVNNHDGTISFTNLPTFVDSAEVAAEDMFWAYKACIANDDYFLELGKDTFRYIDGSVATYSGETEYTKNASIDVSSVPYVTGGDYAKIVLIACTKDPLTDETCYYGGQLFYLPMKVIYDLNGGTAGEGFVTEDWVAPDGDWLTVGSVSNHSITPTKSDLNFYGWCTATSGGYLIDYAMYVPYVSTLDEAAGLRSVTLYAQWGPEQYGNSINLTIDNFEPGCRVDSLIIGGYDADKLELLGYEVEDEEDTVLAPSYEFEISKTYYISILFKNKAGVFKTRVSVEEYSNSVRINNEDAGSQLYTIDSENKCTKATKREEANGLGVVFNYTMPTPHNLSYELDGGSMSEAISLTNIYTIPDTLPLPTKDGFLFGGWYLDDTFTEAAIAGDELDEDVTLYAMWGDAVCKIGTNQYATLYAAFTYAKDGDEIELLQNITLNCQTILNGKTITLNGNGYTIIGGENCNGLRIENASLFLINVTYDGGNGVYHNNYGAGGFLELEGANLILQEDAKICNADVANYSDVHSVFTLNKLSIVTMNEGSTIENIYGHMSAIRLNSGSKFIMNGGTIKDCHTKDANLSEGVVFYLGDGKDGDLDTVNPATFIMKGGVISNCSPSSTSSTSYVSSGIIYMHPNCSCKVELVGGEFDNNSASYGGVVYSKPKGGVVHSVNVSGSIVAVNNYGTKLGTGAKSNVYLGTSGIITISGKLTGDALIGVWTVTEPTASQDIKIAGYTSSYDGSYTDISHIVSDKASLAGVLYCDGTKDYDKDGNVVPGNHTHEKGLWLSAAAKTRIVTLDANGRGTNPDSIEVIYGRTFTAPAVAAVDGYAVTGWYKEATCKNKWNFDTDVVEDDITLYAKWGKQISSVNVTNAPTYVRNGSVVEKKDDEWITSSITFDSDEVTFDYKVLDVAGNSWVGIAIHPKDGYIFYNFSWKDGISGLPEGFQFDGSVTSDNVATYRALYDTDLIYVGDYLYRYIGKNITYITYDGNGNTSGSIPTDSKGYIEGNSITLDNNTGSLNKKGYTFIGWNSNKNATEGVYSITAGKQDVTLYAIYKKEKEIISLTLSAQEYHVDSTKEYSYVIDSELTKFVIKYYVNNAWTESAPQNIGQYNVLITREADDTYQEYNSGVLENYYSVYALIKYVMDKATSGTPIEDEKYYAYCDEYLEPYEVTLATSDYKRTGYEFDGWIVFWTDIPVNYKPGQKVKKKDGDVIIYPDWKVCLNNISYEDNDYTVNDISTIEGISDVSYEWGYYGDRKLSSCPESDESGTTVGYLFSGGSIDKDTNSIIPTRVEEENISGVNLYYIGGNNNILKFKYSGAAKVTTMVAGAEDLVEVTKNSDGYYCINPFLNSTYQVYYIIIEDLDAILTDVYLSNNLVPAEGEANRQLQNVISKSEYSCAVTYTYTIANITLTKVAYTNTVTPMEISFVGGTGSVGPTPATIYQLEGRKITSQTTKKEGYTFVGWYLEDTYKNEWNFDEDTVTDNITLYAKWEQIYTISYDSNGGSAVDSITATEIPSSLPIPTMAGCVFAGWYTDESLTNKAVTGAAITKDTVLYARWVSIHEHDFGDEEISYTKILTSDYDGTPLETGNYFLLEDVTLSHSLVIKAGCTVNICLCEHVLDLNGNQIIVYGSLSMYSEPLSDTYHYFEYTDSKWNYISNPTVEQKENSVDYYNPISDGDIVYIEGGIIVGGATSTSCQGVLYTGEASYLSLENINIIGNGSGNTDETKEEAIVFIQSEAKISASLIFGNYSEQIISNSNSNGELKLFGAWIFYNKATQNIFNLNVNHNAYFDDCLIVYNTSKYLAYYFGSTEGCYFDFYDSTIASNTTEGYLFDPASSSKKLLISSMAAIGGNLLANGKTNGDINTSFIIKDDSDEMYLSVFDANAFDHSVVVYSSAIDYSEYFYSAFEELYISSYKEDGMYYVTLNFFELDDPNYTSDYEPALINEAAKEPNYQWYEDGTKPVLIAGATNKSYTPTKSGAYFCKISYDVALTGIGTLKDTTYTLTTEPIYFAEVSFNADDVEGTLPEAMYGFTGAKITLPSGDSFSKYGYLFLGWKLGDTTYNAGEEYTIGSSNEEFVATFKELIELIIDCAQQKYKYNDADAKFVIKGKDKDIGGFTVQYYVDDDWTETVPTNVGVYKVKITRDADITYKRVSTIITNGFLIEKADAVITVDTTTITVTYGDEITLPEASTNFGTVTCNKTVADLVDADTYTVIYTVVGTDNYNGDSKELTVVINKAKVAEPTVTGTYTYTGAEQTVTVTGVEVYMTQEGTVTATNAGSYTITYTLDSNHEWAEGSDGDVSWTINKAKVAEPIVTGTYTYTGSEQTVTVTGVTALVTTTDVLTGTNADSYTITYTLVDTTNYEWAEGSDGVVTWTIAKADAVITVDTTTITKTYGEAVVLPTATSNFGTVVCDKTVDDLVNANTYTVKYTVASTDNYNGDSKELTVVINKGQAAITLSSDATISVVEGATVTLPNATSNFGTVSCDKTAANLTNPGVYTVNYTVAATDNYSGDTKSIQVVIKAKEVTTPEGENTPDVTVETDDGFDPNMVIEVTVEVVNGEVLENSELYTNYEQQISSKEVLEEVYDVKLLLNGALIKPEDLNGGTTLTIKMLVPESLNGKSYRVLSVSDAGTVSELVLGEEPGIGTYVLENGYLITKVNTLGEFAFIAKKDGLSTGAIIAIVFSCIFLLVLLAYVLGYFFLYRNGRLDDLAIRVIYKWLPRGEKNLKANA